MAKGFHLIAPNVSSGLAGAFLVLASASQATAQDPATGGLTRLAEQARSCDWLIRTGADTNTSEKSTDLNGDVKRAALTGICGDTVLSVRASIDTPPFPAGGGYADGADHSVAAFTFGREFEVADWRAGLYGEAGWMNGTVSDILHDTLESARRKIHRAPGRRSPDATDGRLLYGVMGRADTSRELADFGTLSANFNATPYLRLGNDQTLAGLAAAVSLNTGDEGWRAALPNFPAVLNKNIGVYAGLRVEHVFYDAATQRIGTAHDRAAAFAGAEVNFRGIAVFAQYEQRLTNDITGGRGDKPAGVLFVGGRARF